MSESISDIENGLRERRICAYWAQPRQLVISRQVGPPWPDRGNSFWICKLGADWIVCTWSPYYYRVPSDVSVLDVAEAFVDVGTSAQYRVPADLIERFGLIDVDYDEFDRLWVNDR